MTERRSFLDELQDLDQVHQAERLRPGAVHRIARRLDAELMQAELPARRRTWIPMVSFAAGAAMVLAVFTMGGEPQLATEQAEAAPMHAAWQVGGDNCHVTRGEVELVLDGSCRVDPPRAGVVIESRKTTRLRPIEGGVVVVDGTVMIETNAASEPDQPHPGAAHEAGHEPWRIEVPGGAIEVLSSQLSLVVAGDRGHVDLLEGTMRFVTDDGSAYAIQPGERFRFTSSQALAWATANEPDVPEASEALAAAPEPTTSEDEAPLLAVGDRLAALEREAEASRQGNGTRARDKASSAEELRRLVDRVAELRAQRQYQAAVALLRQALGKRWDRHTREVLSYELGTILSTQLADQEQACQHWSEHRRRFPEGRYAKAIDRAQARLGCGG
ncbi:hypothetical protein [Paraliomyxa miuraensis]|uniref:hypothetical protein n=1 Tax=Paraliomyxa miuraensis TaxID=376150 RepID=UPI002258799A|nr:hypothetical protein [Paraliomyxa miuraensis]MCX4246866.1 hypothetical protein [Paraliomyxa miuraensis]